MDLRQLRLFLAVAESAGITAAARRENITQSALSRRMKALEEELGVELLDRGAHSVRLTAAGELLAEEARRLLRQADAAWERVRAAGSGEPLRIAYAPSLVGDLLGAAIECFTQLHPRARLSLFDVSSTEMRSGLAAGRFDVILTVPLDGDAERIDWRPVRPQQWRVAVASGHELAGREWLAPADLDGRRLVLFARDDYPDYWQRVTGYFRQHGVDAKVAGEFDGAPSLAAAIEAGIGLALVAEGSQLGGRRITLIRLEPPPEPLCVAAGIAAGRQPSQPLQVFIEELRRAAG